MGGLAAGWNAIGGMVFAQHGMGSEVHATHVFKTVSEAPVLLQWLVKAAPWTGFGSFLWLPLMLPMVLVPWWARRQVQRQGSGLSHSEQADAAKYDARLFWLIPVTLNVALLAWFVMRSWIGASAGAHESFLLHFMVPMIISLVGLLIVAFSVPLIFRLVPMNAIYGMRLPASFKSNERWLDVNAYGGRLMGGWALVIVASGLAGFFVLPGYRELYANAAVGMLLLCVFFPLAQLLWWLRRLPPEGPAPRPRQKDFLWGKLLVAIPIAFFIRTFITAFFIASGGSMAPEVPQNTWVMVWKLVPQFHAGDFITYNHEDKTYLGRVSRTEAKQLWITRNNTPEEAVDIHRVTGRIILQSRPSTP
jgi:hypothetical protein